MCSLLASGRPNGFLPCPQVSVVIEDRNDNAPRFGGSASVRIAVPENVATGSAIYTAHATDSDAGANGEVRYELAASTHETTYFRVDRVRGTVSLVHGLDYETVHRLTVTVVARDSGSPPLSGNMTLVVDVQDVNDNAPAFERPHYAATVPESSPVDSQVSHRGLSVSHLISGDRRGHGRVARTGLSKNVFDD